MKKVVSMIALVLFLSLGTVAYLTKSDKTIDEEPVDRSGQVTRVDIPNGDGTFTTLEGEEAQAWYNQAVFEGEQRAVQEANR